VDLQWYTWKLYLSNVVLDELVTSHTSVWSEPSRYLKSICEDVGCIQQGHHELTDLIEDHNMIYYNGCVEGHCENCRYFGFPCANLAVHGFGTLSFVCQWDPQFRP
jgi:hypothetical protein